MDLVVCQKCGTKNRVDASRLVDHKARCGKCSAELKPPRVGGGKPIIITDATFETTVLQSRGVFLLDCWAPWCGPCRMVGPIMDQLALESNGRYQIGKLNVDENPRTASQFQIQSIPTMLLFKDGNLIDRIIGAQPKLAIASRLAQAV